MTLLPDELRLATLLIVNVFVFYAAYRFVRRFTSQDGMGASLDALLLHYIIQYAAVGAPGVLGILSANTMLLTAIALGVLLLIASSRFGGTPDLPLKWQAQSQVAHKLQYASPSLKEQSITKIDRLFSIACVLFVLGYFAGLIYQQSGSPVLGDDSLTYHLPAAATWLQSGRIGLYNTWFFNPANTYSPLAGSMFIAWLIAPIGCDSAAHYAQMPALILAMFAIIQIARAVGISIPVAALAATAALLSRPFISESILVKDDVFLAAFFLAAIAGCSRDRLQDSLGPWRIGAAVGLFFATKYTAFFTAPLMLLAIDAPFRAGWRIKHWLIAAAVAIVIAGPWYLRNLILTGNPLYPVPLVIAGHTVFKGLFVPIRSTEMRTLAGAWNTITGMYFSVSADLMVWLIGGWVLAMILVLSRILQRAKACHAEPYSAKHLASSERPDPSPSTTQYDMFTRRARSPLLRVCLLGPPLGIAIFLFASHVNEIRYAYPSLFLLFTCGAIAAGRLPIAQFMNLIMKDLTATPNEKQMAICSKIESAVQIAVAFLLAIVSIWGGFNWKEMLLECFVSVGLLTAAIGLIVNLYLIPRMRRDGRWRLTIWVIAGLPVACIIYVFWPGFMIMSRKHFIDGYGGESQSGPYVNQVAMWQAVDTEMPNGGRLAYTNIIFTRPLMGFDYSRRVFYIPTRAGVANYHDLPSGDAHVTDQQIRGLVTDLLTQNPNQQIWLNHLLASGADALLVGKQPTLQNPPEDGFARGDSRHFKLIYEDSAGSLFAIIK